MPLFILSIQIFLKAEVHWVDGIILENGLVIRWHKTQLFFEELGCWFHQPRITSNNQVWRGGSRTVVTVVVQVSQLSLHLVL